MNWQSKRESLYKVWTANHANSSFIVIQHGSYVGGVVTDIPHQYTKCDVFLTWGSFFTEEFIKKNSRKNVRIVNFGNPIYNQYNRAHFTYKENRTHKILLLPTALDSNDLIPFNVLLNKLKELQFYVVVKEHGKQGVEKDLSGRLKYPKIEGVTKSTGELYTILLKNDFDFIISDHSTALLDSVFFKNKVLYFDPNNHAKGYTTNYSKYLPNLFDQDLATCETNTFYDLLSIPNQEALFSNMIHSGDNAIDPGISSKKAIRK